MVKYTILLAFIFIQSNSYAQAPQRPKLVVGIVVDQMRWDFLHRYADRYAANGGFKRMMSQGFNCENTSISYVPTYTACGHAGIYTGSVPSIHGITGNNWYDNELQEYVYCTSDSNVSQVGGTSKAGKMSPKNLLTSTICQELKLATNSRSKTVGISLKDRGSILTVGHNADAAWWYDGTTGQWITSTYYIKNVPAWVTAFNNRTLVDKYYKEGWNTLYPLPSYVQSTKDEIDSEVKSSDKGFPYNLSANVGVNYNVVTATPFGNTLTSEFAKANIENERLGEDSITDFLAISYSSPDLIGHAYGPNSIEVEDTYLRLDAELGTFLDYLDLKIGKGQYLVFLSSDHGVAHVPSFMKSNKIPAGNINTKSLVDAMNAGLNKEFSESKLVINLLNNQVILDTRLMESKSRANKNKIKDWVIQFLMKQEAVQHAFPLDDLKNTTLNDTQKKMISNGYYPKRSGHIYVIFKPQWIQGFQSGGTTHGSWNPYDARIPLLWYGWKISPGSTMREVSMSDIAPTLAALLRVQAPNGSVGNVIVEITK